MFFTDQQLTLFRQAVRLGVLPPVDGTPQGALDSHEFFRTAANPFIAPLVKSLRDRGVRGMSRLARRLWPLLGHSHGVALDGKRRRISRDEIQDWIRSRLSEDDWQEYLRRVDAKGNEVEEDSIEDVEPREILTGDSASAFRASLLQGMDQAMAQRRRLAQSFADRFPDAMKVKVAQNHAPVGGPSDPGVTVTHAPGAQDRWWER